LQTQASTRSAIAEKPESLTKPHGSAIRLTPAGETRLRQRMRRLCAQQTPGPELTEKLNQEFHLNWSLQAYFQRAKVWRFTWTAASRAGRRSTPTEFLPEERREACYKDPAFEAREGITDRVICRECFSVLRDGAMDGKDGHLRTMHRLTRKEYRLRNPGTPLFTRQRMADDSGADVRKLMAERAEEYASPAEFAAARSDPKYDEKLAFVICRVARCGFKATAELADHLRNAHGILGKEALAAYRREHGWCPISSQRARKLSSSRNSKRWAKLKAKADRAPKKRSRGRKGELLGDTAARITMAAYRELQGWGRRRIAAELYPLHTPDDAWGTAKNTIFKRHAKEIKREKNRLIGLPESARLTAFEAAKSGISGSWISRVA
jgi:hypothetical protein